MNYFNEISLAGETAAVATSSFPDVLTVESSQGITPIPSKTIFFENNGDICINGTIDTAVSMNVRMLLRVAAQRRMTVNIHVDSPGGLVTQGLAIVDAIRSYPYELNIFCTGLAASMAAVIVASGKKGHRFILPNSQMMIHEPLISGGLGGSATSIQRTSESILETKKTINGLLAEFTGRTVKTIDDATAFDNYFNADEAIRFGLCDAIATGFEKID